MTVLLLVLSCTGDEIVTKPLTSGEGVILSPGFKGYGDNIKIWVSSTALHPEPQTFTITLGDVWFSCTTWGLYSRSCHMNVDQNFAIEIPTIIFNKGQSTITAIVSFNQVDPPQANILLYLAGIAVIVFLFLFIYSILSICRRRQSNQPPIGIVIGDAPAYGTGIPRVSGVVVDDDFYKHIREEAADPENDAAGVQESDSGSETETETEHMLN